tara:strand:+ start:1140 stop:1475 length:336 start_codon:yes stop_codon:yes gene_type:complete
MSNFFDSEMVSTEIERISELQEVLYHKLPEFPELDKEEKLELIAMLEELLDKQKILYTRLSLSDDPAAIKMKNHLDLQKTMLGVPQDVSPNQIFDQMKTVIDRYLDFIDRE